MTGVYVHIPFCIVRCNYCDFNAYSGLEHLADRYVEALLAEIDGRADGRAIRTVFFGGGTPTQLSPAQLRKILHRLRTRFRLALDAEVTIEANPESVSQEVFERLKASGFNRVSIGVQSLTPAVLTSLGRVHDAAAALRALEQAVSAGIPDVNADLIFGTPGESMDDWRRSLEGVVEAGVDHVSAYALTIEQGTPLHAMVERGSASAPDEDDQADKYELCHQYLSERGFRRYEVSNWAKPGAECRHNLGYWQAGDYFGFGAGAHSHFEGRRSWNLKSVQGYIGQSPLAEDDSEIISDRASEAAVLGLRLAEGIDVPSFTSRWGVSPLDRWGSALEPLKLRGLVEFDDRRIAIPPSRLFVAGEVFRALLDPSEEMIGHIDAEAGDIDAVVYG